MCPPKTTKSLHEEQKITTYQYGAGNHRASAHGDHLHPGSTRIWRYSGALHLHWRAHASKSSKLTGRQRQGNEGTSDRLTAGATRNPPSFGAQDPFSPCTTHSLLPAFSQAGARRVDQINDGLQLHSDVRKQRRVTRGFLFMPLMKLRQRIRIRFSGIIVHLREEGDWRNNCFALRHEVWKAWTAVAFIKVRKGESNSIAPDARSGGGRDLAEQAMALPRQSWRVSRA